MLNNEGEILVLEAGISPKEVLKETQFSLTKIKGVIVTHEHKDHSKYINDWLKYGINVYMSQGTKDALHIENRKIVIIEQLRQFIIGGFRILPFEVQHDCNEPVGFLINHVDTGNILFATDTYYIKNRFKNLKHIFIECNYIESILDESELPYKERVLSSHMSLETCIEFLESNDLSKVYNIVLLHLSDSHSDENIMKKAVTEKTGINTVIAKKGIAIQLNW